MKANCLECKYCIKAVFEYGDCLETIVCDFYKKHLGFKCDNGKYSKFRIIDKCKNQFDGSVDVDKENSKRYRESGVKGIFWNYQEQKWDVKIFRTVKLYKVGSYETLEDAKRALKMQQEKDLEKEGF